MDSIPPYDIGESPTVADILNYIHFYGLNKGNVEDLVPKMLRAICRDDSVDAVEEFIAAYDRIDWNWWPRG